MKLLSVEAREIVAVFEISLSDLKKLKRAMDLTELNCNSDVPGDVEATEYLIKEFYPYIDRVLKEIDIDKK